jgi:transcriptional regulator with XRE-family HTH domain
MEKSQHGAAYQRMLRALRKAREDAGLTQEQVVDRLGVYASFLSKVESGERRIDVIELNSLCRIYNVTLFEFLRVAKIGS